MSSPITLTVALTGASGALFGRELLTALAADDRVSHVDFIPSEACLRVLAEELGISGRSDLLAKLLPSALRREIPSACGVRHRRRSGQRQLSIRRQ